MIGTIKTFDLNTIKGLTLTKVELGEFVLKLFFGEHRLDIEEYWEYQDKNNKLIDRSLSSKFRKEFKLSQLEGNVVVSLEKSLETFIFKFSNDEFLRISSPDFEFMSLDQHKAFGDNVAGRAYGKKLPGTSPRLSYDDY